MTASAREFVDWAVAAAGSDALLYRRRFTPDELRPWLGGLSILQWDSGVSDFRYRLFGTALVDLLHRDLTDRHLSVWPTNMARLMRHRLIEVVRDCAPAGSRIAVPHFVRGQIWRGMDVMEQVAWPLSYGSAEGAAALVLAVPIPLESGLDATRLRETTGRLGHWFDTLGRTLGRAPDTPR